LVVAASSLPLWAGDLFHKHCAETQRVTLPSQQVEVTRETPRVVVREVSPAREVVSRTVKHRAAEVGVVPIGTVYLPMAMPMFPAALPAAPASREIYETRELESNPLEAAHRAELAALRSERARRELEVTMEAHQRVLQRIAAPSPSSRALSDSASTAAIEKRLNDLSGEIQKLNDRVTSVEKLLLYHDNLLTQNPASRAAPGPGLPPLAPTTPPTRGTAPLGTPTPLGPGPAPGTGTPPLMVPPPPLLEPEKK
jgi:hypothetical protein